MSTPAIPISHDIRKAVADGLIKVNDKVRAAIVADISEKEFQKRVEATTKVLEEFEKIERDLRKIKPVPTGFDLKGQPVGDPVYSREQVEEVKKATEKLDKLNKALEKALNDNDFSKVFEIANAK
jgi:hypothetical protein